MNHDYHHIKTFMAILAAAFGLWITTARATGEYTVQVTDYNSGQPVNQNPSAGAAPSADLPNPGAISGNKLGQDRFSDAPPIDAMDDDYYDEGVGVSNGAINSRSPRSGSRGGSLEVVAEPRKGRNNNGRQLTTPGGSAAGVVATGEKTRKCLKLDPYSGKGSDTIANFNFPDADVVEIAETLGRLTCLNFIFDKDVKGRISIVSNSRITTADTWKAFLTALDANNFSIIPYGNVLRNVRKIDAKDKQVKPYSGDQVSPGSDLMNTRLMP